MAGQFPRSPARLERRRQLAQSARTQRKLTPLIVQNQLSASRQGYIFRNCPDRTPRARASLCRKIHVRVLMHSEAIIPETLRLKLMQPAKLPSERLQVVA